MEATKGRGYPLNELPHFAIADRWPAADPEVVRTEWSAETVEEALAILRAEHRWRARYPDGPN